MGAAQDLCLDGETRSVLAEVGLEWHSPPVERFLVGLGRTILGSCAPLPRSPACAMLAKDWPRELPVGSVSTVAQHGHWSGY